MYHFIGVAGAGMSSLAQIMYSLGHQVKGSDIGTSFFTTEKLDKNIKIDIFNENNITEDLIIVQGNSFGDDNVEVKKAKKLNLKIYTYQEMVGKLTREFLTISISGCHGKTTTTSMLSHVLSGIVGTNYLIGDGTGYASRENKYFVLEACEYKRHFLSYIQKYAIITNIDLDHVDYYKNIDDMVDAYKGFINNTTSNVIAYGDDQHTRKIVDDKVIYYGFKDDNSITAKNIQYQTKGTTFDVYIKGLYLETFFIKLGGKHMVANALSVITICYLENLDFNKVKKQLRSFNGARRRFAVSELDGNIIIDDYAHHPAEIKATIEAARQKYPAKEIIAVFQPHTFSRTQKFQTQFVQVLSKCDKTYILDIHPARENQKDFPNICSNKLISKIDNSESIEMQNANKLLKHENSVFLFLSPNSLDKLINDFKNKLTLNS